MKEHLVILVTILIASFSYCQKGKTEDIEKICTGKLVLKDLKIDNQIVKYKIVVLYKENQNNDFVAELFLPFFDKNSDQKFLKKVLSKIGKIYKVRLITVYKDCETFNLYYKPFKPSQENEKILENGFFGHFDLKTMTKLKTL